MTGIVIPPSYNLISLSMVAVFMPFASITFQTQVNTKKSKAGFWSLTDDVSLLSQIHTLAECVDESLQRLAIITSLISRLGPISKRDLEAKVVAIAKRLSVLNNINAPEFIDKRAQATLISSIREQGYITMNADGLLVASDSMADIKATVINLVDIEVLQSIAR